MLPCRCYPALNSPACHSPLSLASTFSIRPHVHFPSHSSTPMSHPRLAPLVFSMRPTFVLSSMPRACAWPTHLPPTDLRIVLWSRRVARPPIKRRSCRNSDDPGPDFCLFDSTNRASECQEHTRRRKGSVRREHESTPTCFDFQYFRRDWNEVQSLPPGQRNVSKNMQITIAWWQ